MEKQNDEVINNTNVVYLNYYQRNKEKISARRKEYVKNNYEKVLEKNKNITTKIISESIIIKKRPLKFHQHNIPFKNLYWFNLLTNIYIYIPFFLL